MRTRSDGRRRIRWIAALAASALVVVAFPSPASAAAPPNFWVDKLHLEFGLIGNGGDSAPQTFTVRNTGPGTMAGLAISAPPDQFERTGTTCGSSLAAGASCTVSHRYSPNDGLLPAGGEVAVTATGGAAIKVRLSGSPHLQPLSLRITPLGFDYGNVTVGGSATQSVIITNVTGSNAVFTLNGTNTAPTPPAPFSRPSTTCTSATSTITLAGGASCTINYRFTPTGLGQVTRNLDLVVNQSGIVIRTYHLEFKGTGTKGAFPIKVNPTSLDFGRVAVGTTSPQQTVTLTNISSSPRTIDLYGGAASGFGGFQTCAGVTLAPGGTCTFVYEFTPAVPGFLAAETGIGVGIAGYPIRYTTMKLMGNGTGTAGRPEVTPRSIDLGPSSVGVPTATQQVTLTNGGTAAVTGISFAQSGTPKPQFTVTGTTCGTSLASSASCTFSVRYTPTSTARLNTFYKLNTAQGSTEVVVLGGPRPSVHSAFVTYAMWVFLDRFPSESESAGPAAQIDAGTLSRRAFVTNLAASDEWIEAVVQQLYQDTFGREGDPGGVGFWVRRIQSGRMTVAQVAAEFYASSEYYNGIGGGTDESWVTDLYVKLLERSPDSAGLAYWVGQTESRGRVSVASRMYQSAESRRQRVSNLYEKLLDRAPDRAGRDYWAGRIEREGDLALAIELASSSEFLRRAQYLQRDG